MPPLGLAYLAAVLDKNNYFVSVIDAYLYNYSLNQLETEIQKIKPDVIGITSNIYTAKFDIITAHFIKRKFPHITIIMGGPYPTNEPEKLVKNRYCDIVVTGEGEFVLLDLIKKLDKDEDWGNVESIVYVRNNQIIRTKKASAIQDLDALPFPAWHLFPPLKKYQNLRGVTRRPYVPIMSSRGCPFHCNWCTKSVHGYSFRARSPENILAEMKEDVAKYGVKEFAIVDDTFTLDKLRIKRLCVLIKRAKLNIILNFYNGIRADFIDESLLRFLYSVGINRITVGVESGDQQVVNLIGKALDLKKVKETVKLTKKYRMFSDGFFILGHPYDTEKTMEKTIRFPTEVGFDHAYFFVLIPFPGTDLFELIKKEGQFLINYRIGIESHIVEGKPVFETPNLPAELVYKKYVESYKRFYLRIPKIITLIKKYIQFTIKFRSFEVLRWFMSQILHLLKLIPKGKKILDKDPR
jgi:radical SAM superfamily enzyme YgiQ (UPF0313 family)